MSWRAGGQLACGLVCLWLLAGLPSPRPAACTLKPNAPSTLPSIALPTKPACAMVCVLLLLLFRKSCHDRSEGTIHQTNKQSCRQTYRQTGRQADRHRHRHTCRHTHTNTHRRADKDTNLVKGSVPLCISEVRVGRSLQEEGDDAKLPSTGCPVQWRGVARRRLCVHVCLVV